MVGYWLSGWISVKRLDIGKVVGLVKWLNWLSGWILVNWLDIC